MRNILARARALPPGTITVYRPARFAVTGLPCLGPAEPAPDLVLAAAFDLERFELDAAFARTFNGLRIVVLSLGAAADQNGFRKQGFQQITVIFSFCSLSMLSLRVIAISRISFRVPSAPATCAPPRRR